MKYKKIILLLILLISFATVSNAAQRKEGIDSFPDSYKPYLLELQKKYPNWKFIALYTDLDWNYVIDNENQFGKNLVPKSYSDAWKNTKPGEYNVEVDAGWVDASRRAVEYTMDPRNFLNQIRIFQFESLSYDESTNNINAIEKILYGTEFYNKIVQYYDSNGSQITMTSKYSDLILEAGRTSKVSSYHLASRIKQEVGPFLSHSSISGIVPGFEGLYNFYNIGATSSSEPMGAIKNGLQYAKDGKGASQATKDKYLIPWNNKQRAITGGGIFIGSSYINLGQDTVYLQKFHVTSNDGSLFWHQYMTNVLAPYSESKLIYNGYVNSDLLKDNLSFIIPIYNNMPEIPVQSPAISDSDFVTDNTKVYADVSTTLNVRSGPGTSYESITTVDRNAVMTRIAKGVQKGELWDRVQLENGIIGYVFQSYLKEVPEVQIEKINLSASNTTMKKGDSQKLNVEIYPEDAKNHEIEFTSSNTKVLTVDNSGTVLAVGNGTAKITAKAKENSVSSSLEIQVYTPVTDLELNVEQLTMQEGDSFIIIPSIYPIDASNQNVKYSVENQTIAQVTSDGKIIGKSQGTTTVTVTTEDGNITKTITINVVQRIGEDEINWDPSLKVENSMVTGWDATKMTVEQIKNKIQTAYTIEIYNSKNELLTDTQNAGTGSTIRFIDENNVIKMEYHIVLYGDVNGDGKINSTDLLVLQRHILEIDMLKGYFKTAGNINKNGKNPSSLDSLLIQRHILGLKLIEQ